MVLVVVLLLFRREGVWGVSVYCLCLGCFVRAFVLRGTGVGLILVPGC